MGSKGAERSAVELAAMRASTEEVQRSGNELARELRSVTECSTRQSQGRHADPPEIPEGGSGSKLSRRNDRGLRSKRSGLRCVPE